MMEYTRYRTLSAFREDWEETLGREEIEANLFFACFAGEDTIDAGLWAASAVSDDGLLLSIRRGDKGMVLYHTGGGLSPLCARLVREMGDDDYWPKQFIGPARTVYELIRQINNREGYEYETAMDQRIHALRDVKPVPEAEGTFCPITEMREYLVDYDMDFQREVLNTVTRDEVQAQVQKMIDEGRLYGWMAGDRYVSIAVKARKAPRGAFISHVYTPPEERGKGYATACVAALSRLLLDEGNEYCGLFTDLSNPISNHIYKKMGYEPVCDYTLYRLEGDNQ